MFGDQSKTTLVTSGINSSGSTQFAPIGTSGAYGISQNKGVLGASTGPSSAPTSSIPAAPTNQNTYTGVIDSEESAIKAGYKSYADAVAAGAAGVQQHESA